jgi:hypothetical protein
MSTPTSSLSPDEASRTDSAHLKLAGRLEQALSSASIAPPASAPAPSPAPGSASGLRVNGTAQSNDTPAVPAAVQRVKNLPGYTTPVFKGKDEQRAKVKADLAAKVCIALSLSDKLLSPLFSWNDLSQSRDSSPMNSLRTRSTGFTRISGSMTPTLRSSLPRLSRTTSLRYTVPSCSLSPKATPARSSST